PGGTRRASGQGITRHDGQELQRLDEMQSAVSDAATKGDNAAIETTLKIMRMRGRYLNLFADGKGGGVHVATGPREPMQVVFVKSPYKNEPLPGPLDLSYGGVRTRPSPLRDGRACCTKFRSAYFMECTKLYAVRTQYVVRTHLYAVRSAYTFHWLFPAANHTKSSSTPISRLAASRVRSS